MIELSSIACTNDLSVEIPQTKTVEASLPVETLNKNMLAKRFNKAAKHYDQHANVQQKIALHNIALCEKFFRQPLNILLDLGCGTAKSLPILAPMASTVIGLDISKGMLNEARQSNVKPLLDASLQSSECTTTHFINADIENLPFLSASIDGIYSSMAMQWSKSPEQTMAEISRVLAVNGKACIAIMVGESFETLHNAWASIGMPSRINQFFNAQHWLYAARQFPLSVDASRKTFSTYHCSVSDILHSMKKIGADTRLAKSANDYFSKQEMKQLSTYLGKHSKVGELFELKYELMFLQIKKVDG